MLTLRLTFPWGRYYAHPWGLNPVRLREAEWPPSPWRLLRALTAGWFRAYSGDPPTGTLLALLEKLGRELPEIAVGPVVFSQTVHWQPNFENAKKDSLVFSMCQYGAKGKHRHENHFAATANPVLFRWNDIALDDNQRSLLYDVLPHVTYFGRAESLCRLELVDGRDISVDRLCRPCLQHGKPIRRIAENCRDVFCADPQDFRAADLWSRRANRNTLDPDDAPPHLVEDLLSHQPLPEGALWVSYQMPEGWPGRWVVRAARTLRRKPVTASKAPRIAHYLRFSLQCRVPVPIKFTVPIAEQFRAKGIWHFSRASGDHVGSFALSGHDKPTDADGEHQHAFYIPLGADRSNLNELHVWCPYGFARTEVEALMRVHRLEWGGGKYPIRPVLLSIGSTVPRNCPLSIGQPPSRIWRNRTPFVPPRYFYRGKVNGRQLKTKDAPEAQLAECLRLTGIDTPVEIRRVTLDGKIQRTIPPLTDWEIVRTPEDEEESQGDSIVTAVHVSPNSPRTEKARRVGLFFELLFDAPVAFRFPALGHSSHFGLGLFLPATDE